MPRMNLMRSFARSLGLKPHNIPPRRRQRKSRLAGGGEFLEQRILLSAAPAIVGLGLQNDTGTPGDGVTTDATLSGGVTNDGSVEGMTVEFDVDGDGTSDLSTATNEMGGFSYDVGSVLSYGQQSVAVRAVELDGPGVYNYGTWQSVSFDYQSPAPPANNPPAVNNLQIDSSGNLSGDVSNDGATDGLTIQISYYGDQMADRTTVTNSMGSFNYNVASDLSYGQYTIAARAVEWDAAQQTNIYGDWQSVAFNNQAPANNPPVVNNLQIDSSGNLSGDVSNDGAVNGLTVEISYYGDQIADRTTVTSVSGSFSYNVAPDLTTGQYTIAARAVEWDPNVGIIYGNWQSVAFDYQAPSPPANSPPSISNLQIDSSGNLSGDVSNDGAVDGLTVEISYYGDQIADRTTVTNSMGSFNYNVAPDLASGQYTIAARAVEWDSVANAYVYGNWTTVSFDYVQTNAAPEITSFIGWLDYGDVWVFEGQVADEDPGALTIYFGGLLQGQSVQVNPDGSFVFTWQFPPGTQGTVSAQTGQDSGGETSNMEYTSLV